MIVVVCGLIGAGKSTYARAHFEHITDCEGATKKWDQICQTLAWDDMGETVAPVTCYPTSEESAAFAHRNVQYLWINTNPAQAMANIYNRGRERDLADLQYIAAKNRELFTKLAVSGFHEQEVFETSERW